MAVVWYVGPSDVRLIDSTEWTRVGAAGSTKQWDKTNGWSINQSAFTGPQLTFLGLLNEFTLSGSADGTVRPGSAISVAPDKDITLGDVLRLIDLNGNAPVALTDGATITLDASAGKHFRVTLAGNRTLANPIWGAAAVDGKQISVEVIQDATGTRTLAYGAKFAFGTDVASPTLTTTAAKRDFLFFTYNLTADKWYCTRVVKGY